MAKWKDSKEILERLEVLEERVNILETKIEENKRFAFDEIRDLLLKVMKLEESIKNLR